MSKLQAQGWRATVIWLGGHGIPKLTGIPLLRLSRITPEIYVGAQISHLGKRRLAAHGILSSVNLRQEYDDARHGVALPHHCYLPTVDGEAPTLEQLAAGVKFIRAAVEQKHKVYIHCKSGIGRAPTMAAAYFISQGYSTQEAIALIGRVRPFISLTPVQLAALREFEKLR